MIQPNTQTTAYWENEFKLKQEDTDQLYNYFLETLRPHSTGELVRAIMSARVAGEKRELQRRAAGGRVYQPSERFDVGDEVVFPLLDFKRGKVSELRAGNNPQYGDFKVMTVRVNGTDRQFAAELAVEHSANLGEGGLETLFDDISDEELYNRYGSLVEPHLSELLEQRDEFVSLGGMWFVRSLLVDVNIGHLHLAEAVLDMSGGGPLKTTEIVAELDMDSGIDRSTLEFSLNDALLNDPRFDEVAPKNDVSWFLHRMEPEEVRVTPPPLVYHQVEYDPTLVTPTMEMLAREVADEWSDHEISGVGASLTFALTYPHRYVGTMPLNSTIRHMLPLGRSPRQLFTFRNVTTGEDLKVWVIKEGRYIYGFKEWYEENSILVGAYLTIKKGPEPDIVLFDYDRRSPRREDVRLATVGEGRLRFEFQRRSVGCGYDDLMVVGTDFTAAIEAVRQRAETRTLTELIAALLPELAQLSMQNAVHAKTLYSVMNMIRRVPPEPLFAELISHPAFQRVGDVYWRFDGRNYRR